MSTLYSKIFDHCKVIFRTIEVFSRLLKIIDFQHHRLEYDDYQVIEGVDAPRSLINFFTKSIRYIFIK